MPYLSDVVSRFGNGNLGTLILMYNSIFAAFSQAKDSEEDNLAKARRIVVQNQSISHLQDQIQHLATAHEKLSVELHALEERHEFRNELIADLSTELSLSTARESLAKQHLERLETEVSSLQSECKELILHNASLECRSMGTVSDLESTIQNLELDEVYKELDKMAFSKPELEGRRIQ